MADLQLSTLFSYILTLVFPPRCLGCRKTGTALCTTCVDTLPRYENRTDETLAVFSYTNPLIQKTLWRLKYHGRKEIAAAFGPTLFETVLPTLGEVAVWQNGSRPNWLVVPLPLSPERQRRRGFNQAELLAKALCAEDTEKMFTLRTDILSKIKETKSQVTQPTRAARFSNIKDCFTVLTPLANQHILLIDDTRTTGATLGEATRTLQNAGAKTVITLVVAQQE